MPLIIKLPLKIEEISIVALFAKEVRGEATSLNFSGFIH